ncbi:PIN-like domain-containing protein [Streptomyces sp. NBC_01190]|uniref:PIN-like domain-containing protein n=1 Tax=Streptomyces sp. NBC_01190 TaxID=2903767 RepID=UPI003863C2E6|nr:PIN-like domain-containing protein [Streptomyces sp. NBC_01190]
MTSGQDPADGSVGTPDGQDIRSGFSGYLTPSDSDWRRVLNEGLIVTDTNALLNLYRYNKEARADLISVMTRFGERLWIPHQVAEEFWRNRENALEDPIRQAEQTVQSLQMQASKSVETLRAWANRIAYPRDKRLALETVIDNCTSELRGAIEHAIEIDNDKIDQARDTDHDPILAELEPILRGRVGFPLSRADYVAAVTEAQKRVEAKEPPGYRDKKKDGRAEDSNSSGDYLVWHQVIREAKRRRKDVLLVTGDVKEDWWRIRNGIQMGPRNELAEELLKEADSRLFMLRPDRLLVSAKNYLDVAVRDESVKNVERINEQLSAQGEEAGGWTLGAMLYVLAALNKEASVQYNVIQAAVVNGGFVSRDEVYAIGDYDSDRMLKGFTRPVNRISAAAASLFNDQKAFSLELLSPVYDEMSAGFGRADGFKVPVELHHLLRTIYKTIEDAGGDGEV